MAASKDSKLKALGWKISGMDCASCVAKVRGAVEKCQAFPISGSH